MNCELKEYIEQKILPQYNKNEEGHGILHIKEVINRSLKLSLNYDIDENKVYTIAAYHDIGHYIDKDTHEKISADILRKDKNLEKWFNYEEIELMAKAIEDHRASIDYEPGSIYGKIVSSADRTIIDIDNTIRRTYNYGKKHFPGYDYNKQKDRIYEHLVNKYSESGYAKFYLTDSEFDNALNELRELLKNREKFMTKIEDVLSKSGGEYGNK